MNRGCLADLAPLFVFAVFFFVLFTAARISLVAAVRAMVFLAAAFTAVVAIRLAAAVPDCVRLHLDIPDGSDRIVAFDHQLANPSAALRGVVLNHDRETGPGAQFLGERIVQQPPVTALALEVNAGDVQRAIARIADGQSAIRATACVYAAKSG
jgi:hypothetical protein